MPITLETINNIKINEIKVKKPHFPSNPDLPPFFFSILVMCGGRGFGKTNLSLNMLKLQAPYIDNVIIISPNSKSDPQVLEGLKGFQYKIYDDLTEDIVQEIETEIDNRIDLYLNAVKLIKLIKKLNSKNPQFSDEEIETLEKMDTNNLEEMLKLYKKGRPPNTVLIVDDCMGSNILHQNQGQFVKLLIKNRHRYLVPIILIQNLKSLSAPIRKVANWLFFAPTMDENYRKDLYSIVQGAIPTYHIFSELMDNVAKEKYSFLSVYNNGTHHSDVRINLNKKYKNII